MAVLVEVMAPNMTGEVSRPDKEETVLK